MHKMSHNIRIQLHFENISNVCGELLNKFWMFINKELVLTVNDLISMIVNKFDLTPDSVYYLELDECLLPVNETINILRDNDCLSMYKLEEDFIGNNSGVKYSKFGQKDVQATRVKVKDKKNDSYHQLMKTFGKNHIANIELAAPVRSSGDGNKVKKKRLKKRSRNLGLTEKFINFTDITRENVFVDNTANSITSSSTSTNQISSNISNKLHVNNTSNRIVTFHNDVNNYKHNNYDNNNKSNNNLKRKHIVFDDNNDDVVDEGRHYDETYKLKDSNSNDAVNKVKEGHSNYQVIQMVMSDDDDDVSNRNNNDKPLMNGCDGHEIPTSLEFNGAFNHDGNKNINQSNESIALTLLFDQSQASITSSIDQPGEGLILHNNQLKSSIIKMNDIPYINNCKDNNITGSHHYQEHVNNNNNNNNKSKNNNNNNNKSRNDNNNNNKSKNNNRPNNHKRSKYNNNNNNKYNNNNNKTNESNSKKLKVYRRNAMQAGNNNHNNNHKDDGNQSNSCYDNNNNDNHDDLLNTNNDDNIQDDVTRDRCNHDNDDNDDGGDDDDGSILDVSTFLPLKNVPQIGCEIAYKTLEMSSNYCPVVSNYKRATLLGYCVATGTLQLQLLTNNKKGNITKTGKFDLTIEDEDTILTNMSPRLDIVNLAWNNLIEPRLIS